MTESPDEDVRAEMDELTRSRGAIEVAAKKLTLTLERVESELVALNLGVTATVNLRTEDHDRSNDYYHVDLVFRRRSKGWALFIERGSGESREPDTYNLTGTTLDDRIAAAKALPELVKQLRETFDQRIREIEEACEMAESVLSVISDVEQ